VHALFGAIATSTHDFKRFWALMLMFRTEKINHKKKQNWIKISVSGNKKKRFPHFTTFWQKKLILKRMPKVSFQKLEPSWLLTKSLKIAQNCTSHKLCQKRWAKRQINRLKKGEFAESAKQAEYFAEKLKLLRPKKSHGNYWRKKRHLWKVTAENPPKSSQNEKRF